MAEIRTGSARWLVQRPALTASSAAAIGIRAPTLYAFAPAIALTNCLQAGEPPTEDAEREWQRILRERQQLADMREQVHAVLPQLLLLLKAPAYIDGWLMCCQLMQALGYHTPCMVAGSSCV